MLTAEDMATVDALVEGAMSCLPWPNCDCCGEETCLCTADSPDCDTCRKCAKHCDCAR